MKLMAINALVVLTLGISAHATYVVGSLHGKVESGGQPIKLAQKLPEGTRVSSDDNSAKIKLTDGTNTVTARGAFDITLPAAQEPLTIHGGILRFKIGKAPTGVTAFRARTPDTLAGVRGTDFFLSYSAALHESEIVCFESSVDFSTTDGKSKQVVNAGQWGGIGGRFGKTIAKPLDLPRPVIAKFDSDTTVSE